ncbi:bifunctional glutamate N-acetyltransferase/amino-acid acetyltransferase ArgJ [Gammaproteobacteria bacterium]|nr:bifunctional glutamate N-acetyltransferase/amino-acid acetyltransferase ArgJ [Gammaproteobacteria bacterium]
MPVGLPEIPELNPVPGIHLGSVNGNISKADKDDIALIQCASGTVISAVFTRNRFCAAPVSVAKSHLAQTPARAMIVNSGNANAGTGEQGRRAAQQVCAMVARGLDIPDNSVLPFSTGVIGAQLPIERFQHALPQCIDALSEDNWLAAARAIMTTDIVPKGASRQFELGDNLGDTRVTLTGIVKGSGMIRPDMATMLCFLATDAAIDSAVLDTLLLQSVDKSFHRITIDGDTSTNDACVLMATGKSGMPKIVDPSDSRCAVFAQFLDEVLLELAQSLIRDGEGATKFVAIEVTGAENEADARILAFTVAHSPLVKTALYASDPNWGRILAAIGRADVESLDIDKAGLSINGVKILENGGPCATYTEAAGQKAMDPEEIHIKVELGMGSAETTVWTSDLSYDYVKINAEYRS